MQIINYTQNIDYTTAKTAITIGTFDGVHLGHKKILETLVNKAKENNYLSTIISFNPHPRKFIYQDSIKLLNTPDEKIEIISKYNVDRIVIFPFDDDFAKISYKDFIKILIKIFNLKMIVTGYDNHFGKNREGNYSNLQELSEYFHFGLISVDELNIAGKNISSTKIRNMIENGNISLANEYLGYHYFFCGIVVEGNKIGTKIGFKTANIQIEDSDKLIPPNGVYAVNVIYKEIKYLGMMNIGYRPTIQDYQKPKTIEVNIFDFEDDLYGKIIKVEVIKKIRDEIKFESLEQLKNQLKKDKEQVLMG